MNIRAIIKNAFISGCFFISGVIVSILAESSIRSFIRVTYKFATNNRIYFVGKDFHLFASYYYYLGFGLSITLFYLAVNHLYWKKKIIHGVVFIVVFIGAIFLVSAIDSNLKLISCTMCDDGTMPVRFNWINYDGITILSLALSSIPCLIFFFKRRKNNHTAPD